MSLLRLAPWAFFMAATPALAASLDRPLAAMAHSAGTDYAAARAAAQRAASSSPATLAARLRTAAWTEATWRDDVVAAILAERAAHPEVLEAMAHLRGLDPSHYLARRRRGPLVTHEMQRLLRHHAPLAAELILFSFDAFPFAERYPAFLTDADTRALRQLERRALEDGLLTALGASNHPVAHHVLAQVALDSTRSLDARGLALMALGELGKRDEAVASRLARLAERVDLPSALRRDAVRALGRTGDPSAFDPLSRAVTGRDPLVRHAAVLALGHLGSPAAARRRGGADALRARITGVLVSTLGHTNEPALADAAITALCHVAHPSAPEALRTAAHGANEGSPIALMRENALQRLELALARQR